MTPPDLRRPILYQMSVWRESILQRTAVAAFASLLRGGRYAQ
jgi:hypothetical protein